MQRSELARKSDLSEREVALRRNRPVRFPVARQPFFVYVNPAAPVHQRALGSAEQHKERRAERTDGKDAGEIMSASARSNVPAEP